MDSVKQMRNDFKNKFKKETEKENDIEKNIMKAANQAIKNWIKPKEDIKLFLEKKKEMFLMQMEINLKKQKIKDMENKIKQKQQGLKIAEDHIKKDTKRFGDYFDQSKIETREKIKLAEETTKKKLLKMKELKRMGNHY